MKKLEFSFSYQPRALFLLLLISLSIASYSPVDVIIKIWIFLFGVLIPAGLSLWRVYQEKKTPDTATPPWREEFLPAVPGWFWALAGISLIAVYFYRITEIPAWPCIDDGAEGIYALKLSQKWDWRLLYGLGQAEPLYFWLAAFFFKCFGASIETMRFFPLVLSFLAMGVAYFAARRCFSRSMAYLLLLLYVFNFWNLFESRRFVQPHLIPFFEFITIYALIRHGEQPSAKKWISGFLLGILVGSGFYVNTAWPAFALAVLIAAWFQAGPDGKKTKNGFWAVTLGSLGMALPMIWARLGTGGLSYAQYLLNWKGFFYFTGAYFFYGFGGMPPAWGGILNSLMGACFWVGAVEAFQWRRHPMIQWLFLTGFLTFLPGGLTSHVEMFRTSFLFPVLIFFIGLGAQALLEKPTAPFLLRWTLVTGFLACSLALDLYHYYGPFQNRYSLSPIPAHWNSIQLYRASTLLEAQARQGNRIEILGNFNGNQGDWAFELFARSLNAEFPVRAGYNDSGEIELITNSNFLPFLERKFPNTKWTLLGPDMPIEAGGLALVRVAYSSKDLRTLKLWREAEAQFESLTVESAYLKPGESFQTIVKQLSDYERDWEGDAFLRALCAERIAVLTLQDPSLDRKVAIGSLGKAVTGCQAANLFDLLGLLWLEADQPLKARDALQSALRLPVNTTLAASNLNRLQSWARVHHVQGF